MRTVLGIDVSKSKSNLCLVSDDGEIITEKKICNDLNGFEVIKSLFSEFTPEVIFEATGVYSRKLQYFLELNGIAYTCVNPLKAKKEMDTLRVTKNDRIDSKNLAILQLRRGYSETKLEKKIYLEIRRRHRFYQSITEDSVSAQNRLHKVLQETFSGVEDLFAGTELNFFRILTIFPHAQLVSKLEVSTIAIRISEVMNRRPESVLKRAEKLKKLAVKTAVSVETDSYAIDEVRYWAKRVLDLAQQKKDLLEEMYQVASELDELQIIESIPGIGNAGALGIIAELGDIRRFSRPQKMSAFLGLDIRFSDSGKLTTRGFITKRGNSAGRKLLYRVTLSIIAASRWGNNTSVSDWYNRRAKDEHNGKKKIIVGAMDRTLRLIHHLVFEKEYYLVR
ncbi:transposase [Weissella oryzae SG25]|uniref:Transposase n=1 Tax=Weissella oryzae (strain DSM 25784 / JCM 18191 / LMG 30913 / SG25) TaxID=1329250 RepID=A0A069CU87_WEIOS|nr:IS110 family transposase [Weissella oryzae]GAK31350.1 transposase [Weissella oryzae SG25]